MALSMLLAITTAPALLGTQEAIRQSQSKNKREEHRARRCNLIVNCVQSSSRSREINNRVVVLRNNKLYIETGTNPDNDLENEKIINGHPFNGYFLPYPDTNYEGLVSTITDVAPILNWIYIDKETYEVKYGVRDFAQPNLTGPFDCTRQDRRMKFEDWEGFVAVEEGPGIWAVYFDRDDDALRGKIPSSIRVLEIELTRRESKNGKPDPEEATTLDEMMKKQKEQDGETPEVAESEKQNESAMGAQPQQQQQEQQEKPQRQPEPAQAIRSAQPPEPAPADSPYYVAPLKVTPSPRVSQRGAPPLSQHQPGKQIRPQSQHQPGKNVRPERQTKVPVTPEVPKSGKQDQAPEIAVQPEQTAQPAEPTPPSTEAPTQPAKTAQQETTTTIEPEKGSTGAEKTSTGEEKTSTGEEKTSTGEEKTSTGEEKTSPEAGKNSTEPEKASTTEPEKTAPKAEDTPPADKPAEPAKKPPQSTSVFSRFRGLLG